MEKFTNGLDLDQFGFTYVKAGAHLLYMGLDLLSNYLIATLSATQKNFSISGHVISLSTTKGFRYEYDEFYYEKRNSDSSELFSRISRHEDLRSFNNAELN